jgi:hypothetical protein
MLHCEVERFFLGINNLWLLITMTEYSDFNVGLLIVSANFTHLQVFITNKDIHMNSCSGS